MAMGTEKITPKFGQTICMIYASDDNPQKYGIYVETIVRRGKLNPGFNYRITNGRGDFWECAAKDCVVHGKTLFYVP